MPCRTLIRRFKFHLLDAAWRSRAQRCRATAAFLIQHAAQTLANAQLLVLTAIECTVSIAIAEMADASDQPETGSDAESISDLPASEGQPTQLGGQPIAEASDQPESGAGAESHADLSSREQQPNNESDPAIAGVEPKDVPGMVRNLEHDVDKLAASVRDMVHCLQAKIENVCHHSYMHHNTKMSGEFLPYFLRHPVLRVETKHDGVRSMVQNTDVF
jgi:hypothetical protein